MNPLAILAIVEAALTIIEKAVPAIQSGVKDGEISIEAQNALDLRIQALRPGGKAFSDPAWQVEP